MSGRLGFVWGYLYSQHTARRSALKEAFGHETTGGLQACCLFFLLHKILTAEREDTVGGGGEGCQPFGTIPQVAARGYNTKRRVR